jgi:phosphatidylglycerophosphate synthase
VAYDGLVSRYVNRHASRPIARALRPTPVTPNAATLVTLVLAMAAGALTGAGWQVAGGIAIQVVSIVDGVDGDLARFKGMATRFGGVLDTVTDRYADAIVLAGMAFYAYRFEDWPRPETIAVLALAGSLMVSYSRARIEASLAAQPSDGVFGLASRDVRLLIAAIGTIAGQCYWTLVVLAAISALTVAWRLLYLKAKGIGTTPA